MTTIDDTKAALLDAVQVMVAKATDLKTTAAGAEAAERYASAARQLAEGWAWLARPGRS